MYRIALAVSKTAGGFRSDGPSLVAAFEAAGVSAEIVPWGIGPDWAGFDGVVIRNAWDYVFTRAAFLEWAADVSRCTRLANSLEVLEWNTDKRYLRDLDARGVPTVPTLWVECGERMPIHNWDDFVVKPSISAGARLSARYRRGGDPGDHIRLIHAAGSAAMIQPYLRSVDRGGEIGTYVFGGKVSYGIRKGPVLVPGRAPNEEFQAASLQAVSPVEVEPQLAAFALQVLEASPTMLYARVDSATGVDGQTLLLELEATEPYLFLEHAVYRAESFVRSVKQWLESPTESRGP